jgi:hypothetical protein
MAQPKIHLLGSLFLFVACISTPAWANAPAPTFTVTVKSAYLRDAPSFSTPHTYSVFRDQTFSIIGRTADALWLQLDFASASRGTWIMASFGTVKGKLDSVPVAANNGGVIPLPPDSSTGSPASATGPARVSFTVVAKSTFGYDQPTSTGAWSQSLFKGQVFNVRARTADSQWVQVDVTGATMPVWVRAEYGMLKGDLGVIPLFERPATPAPTPLPVSPENSGGPSDYPIVPVVGPHAREIYQYGLSLGNNPRAFSKVGDCQNVTPFFLASFDNPADYRLGSQYAYLQATITNFRGSFTRKSESVNKGFNVASVLNPAWSNPKNCRANETPLECEFRIHRPSVVIINMETWWTDAPGAASAYEANLRQIVEFAISHGVVPILGTKADNLEKDGSLNAAIVRVAQAYDVPLWNFWLAVQPLPNHGLLADGFHLTWGRAFYDDPANFQYAWPWRNLTALQALDAVWRAVNGP